MVTHVEVGPGMLQDQLRGVWFVLAVVHIHLELVRLSQEQRAVSCYSDDASLPKLT